jgi:hypothetical protein
MVIKRNYPFWLLAILFTSIAICPSLSIADNSAAVAWQRDNDKWMSFETAHFQFNYLEAHQVQADRAAVIAEKAWPIITSDLNWEPRDRIQVVVVDDFDFSNGFASPLPYNQMRLFLSPPENMSGLGSYDDWLNLLITHELTHVVHLDMAMGAPSVIRKIFGRNLLTFPHAFTPDFMVEGLAVYKETDHQAGIGRGQSSHYAMLMRQEVIDGIDDLSQITIPLRDWPFGKQYLYGYYYYQFLAERFGEQKITEYLNSYSRKLLPFLLQNRTARRTFGKDHEALWLDFKQWLQHHFAPQIERINQRPLAAGAAITHEGLSFDPVTANAESYYYLHRNGMDRPAIIRLDDNGERHSVISPGNLIDMDVTDDNQLLITRYLTDGDGRAWADIFAIIEDSEERLTFKKRYRTARWQNQGETIIAKRINAGITHLDFLTSDGQLIEQLWQGTLDEVVGDFSISHDGKTLVASLKRKQQGWNLELLDLNSRQWQKLTDTKAIESGARFDSDDQSIIFSANYDDTFNIYRMALASGELQQLSHVMGAAIKPVKVGDQIFYQDYTAKGYNHYQLPIDDSIKSFNVASRQDAYDYSDWYQLAADRSEPENYSPWATLVPRQWFPILFSDEESSQLGVFTTGSDALSRHSYSAAFSYDVDNEISAASGLYFYDNKWVFLAQRSHSYTQFSNVAGLNVRREDAFELARINLFNSFENALKFSTGISIDDEHDLTGSGFTPIFNDSRKALFGLRLNFDNREFYSQSISPSWGNRSSLIVETNDAFDSDFSGEVINANVSQLFDLAGNHVLAINVSGAYGTDRPEPFRLGGEDSIFNQTLFGRDSWALRGYDDNVQIGTRIQTNTIEYRFPITNIERNWDLIPVGVGQISSNVFIENGAAWNSNEQADYLAAVGIEINSELVFGYGLILPVNLGYAYGLDDAKGGSRGYLRIGYAF